MVLPILRFKYGRNNFVIPRCTSFGSPAGSIMTYSSGGCSSLGTSPTNTIQTSGNGVPCLECRLEYSTASNYREHMSSKHFKRSLQDLIAAL